MEEITVQITLKKTIPKSQREHLNSLAYIKNMTIEMMQATYEVAEDDILIVQVEGK